MTYSSMESPIQIQDQYHNPKRFDDEPESRFYWGLILLEFTLFAIGIWNLMSATSVEDKSLGLHRSQFLWFGIGLIITAVILVFHYSILSRLAYFIYAATVVLLVLVLTIGKASLGARRWLSFGGMSVQPSEFMKLTFAIVFAKYFETDRAQNGYGFKELLVPTLIFLIPSLLIKIQPDLGTAMVVMLSYGSMVLFLGLKRKTLLTLIIGILIAAPVIYQFALKPYQRQRIISFIDPNSDPTGASWNSRQSMIAIGSGQLLGKGYKKGTQSRLNFLPEHHTDFVFAVFSEEHGFLGCFLVLLVYLMFINNGLTVAFQSNDKFATLLALSIVSVFFWQAFINIGMVCGLLPVVGVPLPFFSYGGSSLLTSMMGVAILTNIANKRTMF